MHRKSSYLRSKFFEECLVCSKIHLIDLKLFRLFFRFNSHFRLLQMTLKSITFVQNHYLFSKLFRKLFSIFTKIMRILTSFFILSVREIYHCVNTYIGQLKVKDAIMIHVEFRGALKIMILRCFITLYVQILSDIENWDIFFFFFFFYQDI